jgi:hypothetical protein
MVARIAVFCGSAAGSEPAYVEQAQAVGRSLAERGIGLVYGGAASGTMGVIADAALAAGGEVIGVIPDHPKAWKLVHPGLTEVKAVEDVYRRKSTLVELSSAFLALPGGVGTVDELFEVWSWGQVRLHTKPIGLLDVNGFYQPLLAFIDHMVVSGFLTPEHRSMLSVSAELPQLLDAFDDYQPPETEKWG